MQASEFQDTAERLVQGTTEGDWRSAVSRAYYAVFHFFLEFFLSHGLDLGKDRGAHNSIYTGLYNCGLPAVVPFGNQVDELRDARNKADYELNRSLTRPSAQQDTDKARQLMTDFQAALVTTPAQQVVDGVRQYLRSIGRIPP